MCPGVEVRDRLLGVGPVVRVDDDPGFCAARARNLGAKRARSTWICFIDADIKIKPGWMDWMNSHLDDRFHYRCATRDGVRDKETWGTCLCPRKAFERVGGYDEIFRGWGGEDDDLYTRLSLSGVPETRYPADFIEPIRHDDESRLKFYDVKDRDMHHCINQFYSEAKLQIMSIQGKVAQPPLKTRRELMEYVTTNFTSWLCWRSCII